MRGGQWSQDCAGEYCFGVPLYRQFLTDGPGSGSGREWKLWSSDAYKCDKSADQDRCDFPFIRMTVSATWQRNTLTANGGTYYFDSTRPENKQPDRNNRRVWGQRDDPALGAPGDDTAVNVECSQRLVGPCYPRSVNVFQGGQTYDVFFVYSTDQLKQTYQVYVGSETGQKFNPKTDVQAILVRPEGLNFKINHFDVPTGTNGKPIYNAYLIDSKTGSKSPTGDVLEVEVDFTKLPPKINNEAYSFNPNNAANKDSTCRPAAFCSWSGTTPEGKSGCGCSLTDKDPLAIFNKNLLKVCAEVCNTWAVKQIDCPDVGCLGFSFKLPDGFKALGQYKRPPPKRFPVGESPWTKLFSRDEKTAGACTYSASTTPGDPNGTPKCEVPNIADLEGLPPPKR
jgi:hypothetical protein